MENTKDYKFKFSVVTGVYNVEKYLDEMIKSIVHQTIGFKKNIELILVDDGSTDSSGKICDSYKAKYPDNIRVIHKANGGISSARNAGLEIASGKYINFCDADDKFQTNAFAKVWEFFEKHQGKTDVVCVPLYFFEGQKGPYFHNYKFDQGTRIIDLNIEPQMSLFQVNSSFFVNDVKNKVRFDERLSLAEDLKFVSTVLIEKLKLGVVADTKYFYRKRIIKNSAVDSGNTKETYFADTPKYCLDELRRMSQKKLGYVHPFIQYDLLYDIRWRFLQSEPTMYYFGKDDEKHNEYIEFLIDVIKGCDSKFILDHKRYDCIEKLFLIAQVKGETVTPRLTSGEGTKDVELIFNDTPLFSISKDLGVTYHFFEINDNRVKEF